MADTNLPAGRAPANLSRADRRDLRDLLAYCAVAAVIAFLPNILCACGIL